MPNTEPHPTTPHDAPDPESATSATTPTEESDVKIATLEQEVNKLKDAHLRTVAEAENTRKRAERDIAEAHKYAVAAFARGLAPALENLYRALGSISESDKENNKVLATLVEGVALTEREITQVCAQHGLIRIFPLGEMFDHNLHQAVAQVESTENPVGTVLQVVQAGYKLHDRLIQPAMVCVAKKPGEDAAKTIDTSA